MADRVRALFMNHRGLRRFLGALVAVLPVALVLTTGVPPAAAGPFVGNVSFTYSGGDQYWTIPLNTTQLVVTSNGASGAGGGSGIAGDPGGSGGVGYQFVTTVPVGGASALQPGDQLQVFVGGQGGSPQLSMFAGGGGGGGSEEGGNGGGGGGGSAVYDETANQWINIADGGGGGSGADGFEGNDGKNGGSGYAGGDGYSSNGGAGGSQPSVCSTPPGSPNNGTNGGNAGTATASGGGGGGGGGCLGGNGGGAGGVGGYAGGGGSTGAPWSTSLGSDTTGDAPTGNGSVSVQYTEEIPVAPTITSADNITFTTGSAGTFTVTTGASTSPTAALSELGALPNGVTFVDNGNGTATLAGTPSAGTGGIYAISFVAANTASPPAIQSFTLTVDQAPRITSADQTTFTAGEVGTFTVTATGYPTPSLTSHNTLPNGVTFVDNGDGTATLAGTPSAGTGGVYPITIGASNGVGTNASQSFTLTVNQAPGITSGDETTFTVGDAGTFTVTTADRAWTTPALSEVGALPHGVSFTDNGDGTGTLAGTPGAGTGGTYPISFVATNTTSPPAIQSFSLTVDQAPAITSAQQTTFVAGTPGNFTVTTTGNPTATLSEIGALPPEVTFTDNGNGTATLAGTPEAGTGGVYPITIGASNGVGSDASQSFTLTVDQAPAITSADHATFVAGSAGTFTVTSTGFPSASLTELGALPAGVSFTDNGDGTATLAGTPAPGTGGIVQFAIQAANATVPVATQHFNLTVDQAPVVTSPGRTGFTLGQSGSFTVTASGYPAPALSLTGQLPAGLAFSDNGNGTATISGTPSHRTTSPVTVTVTAKNAAGTSASPLVLTVTSDHAWLAGSAGGVYPVGSTPSFGSMQSGLLNKPVVGTAATPDGGGYWLVASDGGIFAFGDAAFYGSTGAMTLNKPIVGMAATPDGAGYWLVASDGGIFAFGDAAFYGSTGAMTLNKPIVGMAATPDGAGYWLVASDGGIFAFGDAAFYGSTGSLTLNDPIVGMAATPDGAGYWLVASDGGIFSFGDAAFYGSGAGHLSAPVVAIEGAADGAGYSLVTDLGDVVAYGDGPSGGSLGGYVLNGSIVGIASP